MRPVSVPSVLALAACAVAVVLLSDPTAAAPPAAAPARVAVCHVPKGNPDNARTIHVSPDAVAAHLAHGDSLGECGATGGCTSNADCAPDDYCAKDAGDCGGTGTCLLRPDFCITIFDPVCGCDGITYSNDCFAASAGTNVAHAGPC